MTHHLSTTTPSTNGITPSTDGQRSSTREAVRDVGSHATRAGADVAQSAREQGREVVNEASRQTRNLYGAAREQLSSQAGEQQRRAAGGLRSLGDEMHAMAQQGGQSGPVTEIVRQAAERVHGVAGWLEQREPGEMIAEVRDLARRNPGTFLAGAALLGILAGRLTRNVASASTDNGHATYPSDPAYPSDPTYPSGAAYRGDGAREADETVPLPGYDNERTEVLPPSSATRPAVPPAGHPGATPVPPAGPSAMPAGSPDVPGQLTGTDPLPGVPTSGARR